MQSSFLISQEKLLSVNDLPEYFTSGSIVTFADDINVMLTTAEHSSYTEKQKLIFYTCQEKPQNFWVCM